MIVCRKLKSLPAAQNTTLIIFFKKDIMIAWSRQFRIVCITGVAYFLLELYTS